ncbi:hypothetical protein DMB65_13885 [Flavobacterium cheongpyeongense]|uniref:Uncharacterized protein n=1 Tax=Flavobacterium cheongpyeongense TaxID=2212651 RepID=A0A2V4BQB3_9FLAO|nr:hypothetical protein [Flavobacterium cheongpyeongense]PXY40153.1 hypothetical protein DMB65_13885 [Flavobacterium cheongpyeongense]
MINNVLLKFTHLYYPKNICPWNEKEKYRQTVEYKRLQSTIDYFNSDENLIIRDHIKKVFVNDEILKDFEDFSRLDSNNDRCYTFFLNIFEEGELYSITLYISVLIPYYVIRKDWHSPEPFFSKSRVEELEKEKFDKRTSDELITDIEKIVEEKLLYKKFPSSLMNNLISDISFGDIHLGYFTMFNAFFNNNRTNENNN